MRNYITEILEPFFDFLTVIVNKFGTKFVLAALTEGALFAVVYYKLIEGCPPWLIPVVMGAVCVAYMIFRSKQELAGTPPPDTTSVIATTNSSTKTVTT